MLGRVGCNLVFNAKQNGQNHDMHGRTRRCFYRWRLTGASPVMSVVGS